MKLYFEFDCKKAEEMGLYVREIDEPTDLGWFLLNLDTICVKLRELFME